MRRITIVGGATGREHAFVKKLVQEGKSSVSSVLWAENKFVKALSDNYIVVDLRDVQKVKDAVLSFNPDYVLVGQGEVTQQGLRDLLDIEHITTIAPTKEMARIEGSKSFFRQLLEQLDHTLVPRYRVFTKVGPELREYVATLEKVVVKCDGVISGPRVRIYDADSRLEAITDAENWILKHGKIVVEEFITGHEVALMSFTDGRDIIHSHPFRNYKRISDGDQGENTSGMGTITTGSNMPFFSQSQRQALERITESLFDWIKSRFEEPYIGSLYGEFIVNEKDVKVIEYNCRFGNPSSMNMLQLLQRPLTDFLDALATGHIRNFASTGTPWHDLHSLSAYVVPLGYPYSSDNVGAPVDVSMIEDDFYCGNMGGRIGEFTLKASRGFAVCHTGPDIQTVREKVYHDLARVKGPIHYRKDMGLLL